MPHKKVGRPRKAGRRRAPGSRLRSGQGRKKMRGRGTRRKIGRTLQGLAAVGVAAGPKHSLEETIGTLLGGLVLGAVGEVLVQAENRSDRRKQRGGRGGFVRGPRRKADMESILRLLKK